MDFLDLIIIYLACGSPFGVYQATKSRETMSAAEWVKIVSYFLLWPAFFVSLVAKRLSSTGGDADSRRDNRVEQIRHEIEQIAFSTRTTASLFEFREIFYRYTGLLDALNAEVTTKLSFELFKINGRREIRLASKCLARRNREKLEFHQMRARNEFVDTISTLAEPKPEHSVLVTLALELAGFLGDGEASADLSALLPAKTKTANARSQNLEETPKRLSGSISSVN